MIRRAALLSLALFMSIAVSGAAAAPPEGPRLAIAATHVFPEADPEIVMTGPAGEAPQRLVGGGSRPGPVAQSRLSWSADGSLLAFTISSGGALRVAVVSGAGTGLRVFKRAVPYGDLVVAPDGGSVAFARFEVVSGQFQRPVADSRVVIKTGIWSVDVEDGSLSQLMPWRIDTFIEPSSYSPDGSTLAATVYDRRGVRAVAIDLRTGVQSLLVRNALGPIYSPDGERLAFARIRSRETTPAETPRLSSELLVVRADGGGAKRLLRRRGLLGWPSWDPSGERLAFTRFPARRPGQLMPEPGNSVMAINRDGTCLTKVFSDPERIFYGAAWQPGPGREAGRISC